MKDKWDDDTLFGEVGTRENNSLQKYRSSSVDVEETNAEFIITVEIPGVAKEDIEIYPTATGISVKAEKRIDLEEESEDGNSYETRYSGYYEHIPLPKDVDKENIDAKYKNGVLELKIPKRRIIRKKTDVVVKS